MVLIRAIVCGVVASRLPNPQRWDGLYKLRRARNWDRRRLAHEMGCSLSTVCGVESGRYRVSEQFIDRACQVFGITDTWELESTVPPVQQSRKPGRLPHKAAS